MSRLGLTVFGPLAQRYARLTWARFIPPVRHRRFASPWEATVLDVPPALLRYPGTKVDGEAEEQAFRKAPLYYLFTLHPENLHLIFRYGWDWVLPTLPGRLRMQRRLERTAERPAGQVTIERNQAHLGELIRAEARKLGISAVGFAPFDEKYVFAGAAQPSVGSVVVCLLEQDWAKTQSIPSSRCEREAMLTYQSLSRRTAKLASFIQQQGYAAVAHGPTGDLASIPFAVQAGLGQLGMNGQLLTPHAGSRCRIMLITTDAELENDTPVDFGIPAICDECQICARRCPSGAIPTRRIEYRGIVKHKIKPERCLPILMQEHGCAVCMKVCPVQRYGLPAVIDEFRKSGEILGRGSDELEGYPFRGRSYGPDEHPRVDFDLLHPSGWTPMDRGRTAPPAGELKIGGAGGVV
jgi:ferredoxin